MKVWKITKTKVKYKEPGWVRKAIRKGKLSPGDRIDADGGIWEVVEVRNRSVTIRHWAHDTRLPKELADMVEDVSTGENLVPTFDLKA